MERFQKIKNARKRLNVENLCRCCGLESDEKFNILQIFEDGVEFKDKMLKMIGKYNQLKEDILFKALIFCRYPCDSRRHASVDLLHLL